MAPRPEPIVAHMAFYHYKPEPGLDPKKARETYTHMMLERLKKEGEFYIDVLIQQHNKQHEDAFKADDPDMMAEYHTHPAPW